MIIMQFAHRNDSINTAYVNYNASEHSFVTTVESIITHNQSVSTMTQCYVGMIIILTNLLYTRLKHGPEKSLSSNLQDWINLDTKQPLLHALGSLIILWFVGYY